MQGFNNSLEIFNKLIKHDDSRIFKNKNWHQWLYDNVNNVIMIVTLRDWGTAILFVIGHI